MIKKEKIKEKIDINEQSKDIYKVWAENYTAFLKMWSDSHLKLYKPIIESMGELLEKASNISQESVPEKYREFYEEWIKTYQNSFGKFCPIPAMDSGKEAFESLMTDAEESNRLYKSWISELDRNSKNTQEVMLGEPSVAKYKECYDMWISSYEKMFDDFLSLPIMKRIRENMWNYTGIPDIHSETYRQMTKLWKDSYSRLYMPWVESALTLSEKATEIARGNVSPEVYKEFYNLWTMTYQDNYSRLVDEQSMKPSKETFDNFTQNVNIYLNMYRSWITALEKMSEKSKELSEITTNPEANKEFCDLWVKMYDKAFDTFFEDMPMVGPMKDTMEPVKVAAKTYADAYVKMSRMLTKSTFDDASWA
jgi:hypothetical protein